MAVWLARIRPDRDRLGLDDLFAQRRKRRIDEKRHAFATQVATGTEGVGIVDVLGGPIDPGPLCAVERHFFAVAGIQVLAKELAQMQEPVAEMADHREVAQY